MKRVLLLSALLLSLCQARLQHDYTDAPWNKAAAGSALIGEVFTVTNKTGHSISLEKIVLTIPHAPKIMVDGYDAELHGIRSVKKVSDEVSEKVSEKDSLSTWEITVNNTGYLKPEQSSSFTLLAEKNSDRDWTPVDIQYLTNRRYVERKGLKTAPAVALTAIPELISSPDFYNESLYVPDTIGIRGIPAGAGFIDTWVDQETGEPITQAQMNFLAPDSFMRVAGSKTFKFRPDLMGIHYSPDGKGPMYGMSLIAVQELFSVDMQMFTAKTIFESLSAIEDHAWHSVFDSQGNWVGQELKSKGLITPFMGHDNALSPTHMSVLEHKAYVFDGFPDFFMDADYVHPGKYIHTPGAGTAITAGNSAQQINGFLNSTLYATYFYEYLLHCTDWNAEQIFSEASDRHFALKFILLCWNKGHGSHLTDILKSENITSADLLDDSYNFDYLQRFYPSCMDFLSEVSKNSVNNGGECEIYDDSISHEKLAEFFSGMNCSDLGVKLGSSLELAESGALGAGGLLHHYRISVTERKALWSDVAEAFDLMKGRAPSGMGADNVSLRYDFLTLLRVAKGHLETDVVVPASEEFIRSVAMNSTNNPNPTPNPISPVLAVSYSGDTIRLTASGKSEEIRWCSVNNWGEFRSVQPSEIHGDTAEFLLPKELFSSDSIWVINRSSSGGEVIRKIATERKGVGLKNKTSVLSHSPKIFMPSSRQLRVSWGKAGLNERVSLSVIDFRGRVISKLVQGVRPEVLSQQLFDLSGIAKGQYLLQISASGNVWAQIITVK